MVSVLSEVTGVVAGMGLLVGVTGRGPSFSPKVRVWNGGARLERATTCGQKAGEDMCWV